ncbi:hypothetical protein M9H77_07853 [Catharanthus roseus]|uniref:Uncharacterized protein n=1 Tax=Catharanthus roseus TaxID=4058 RepID=A0ACC0BWJ4_CATRO|nr:hypothetical protein M9H77_07853 [Catharanthus roseus]
MSQSDVSYRPMKVNELVLHLKISPYHPVIHILIELNGNKLGIHRANVSSPLVPRWRRKVSHKFNTRVPTGMILSSTLGSLRFDLVVEFRFEEKVSKEINLKSVKQTHTLGRLVDMQAAYVQFHLFNAKCHERCALSILKNVIFDIKVSKYHSLPQDKDNKNVGEGLRPWESNHLVLESPSPSFWIPSMDKLTLSGGFFPSVLQQFLFMFFVGQKGFNSSSIFLEFDVLDVTSSIGVGKGHGCGSCGYPLNLTSSARATSGIGSEYRKSIKKGFISFISIDLSRFTQVDEVNCFPISFGRYRSKTKLLCRKCGGQVGYVCGDSRALCGLDSPTSSTPSSKTIMIKIRALQPSEDS